METDTRLIVEDILYLLVPFYGQISLCGGFELFIFGMEVLLAFVEIFLGSILSELRQRRGHCLFQHFIQGELFGNLLILGPERLENLVVFRNGLNQGDNLLFQIVLLSCFVRDLLLLVSNLLGKLGSLLCTLRS